MNRHFEDPFINILPKLDLHGETRDTVRFLIRDFIDVNKRLGHNKVVIIHGKGNGVLRAAVREVLTFSKDVDKFYIYGSNDGLTIVELQKESNKKDLVKKKEVW